MVAPDAAGRCGLAGGVLGKVWPAGWGVPVALGGLLKQRSDVEALVSKGGLLLALGRVDRASPGERRPDGSTGRFVPDADLSVPTGSCCPVVLSLPVFTLARLFVQLHCAPEMVLLGRPFHMHALSAWSNGHVGVCFGAFASVSVFLPGFPTR